MKIFIQDHGKIPIAKSVLFDHFKTLHSATSSHHSNHEYSPCETIVNFNIIKSYSVEEVTACLKKMQNGKSTGHDDVFPDFFMYAHENVTTLPPRFFKKILESDFVPQGWALSIYRPFCEKGDKKDQNNSRGISLASCLCKLVNSLITGRIEKELEKKQILGQEQACPICYNIDLSSQKEKTLCDFC